MITFKLLSLLLNVLQTSEDKLGISPLNSVTGKANAEWMVIAWILKEALPVGADSNTLIASGLVPGSDFIYLTKPSHRTRVTVHSPTAAPTPIYRNIGCCFIVLKQCRVRRNIVS